MRHIANNTMLSRFQRSPMSSTRQPYFYEVAQLSGTLHDDYDTVLEKHGERPVIEIYAVSDFGEAYCDIESAVSDQGLGEAFTVEITDTAHLRVSVDAVEV